MRIRADNTLSYRRTISGLAAAVVGLVSVAVLPATAALAYTDLEGEAFTIDSEYGAPYADSTASGGQALAIWRTATATGQLAAAQPFTSIKVTAMGNACAGVQPQLALTVDGADVSTVSSVGSSWSTYAFSGSWSAGAHTVGVRFLNEYGDGSCDRYLEVDKIRVSSLPITKRATAGTVTSPAAVVADSTATAGGQTVKITGTGSVAIPYPTIEGFDSIVVSARGDQCGGAPTLRMALDGTVLGTQSFPATPAGGRPWREMTRGGNWSAGNHTVTLSLANPYAEAGCTRALYLDLTMVTQTAAYTGGSGGQSGFVTRAGKQLMLDGKPFKFVGLNAFGMSGCEGTAWSNAQLDDYFARLAPNAVTRTWAFDLYGIDALDRIVAAAGRHQQKVIFTLADGRNYCGEHDGWSGGEEGTDKLVSWYTGGFRTKYLPWVRQVVDRFKNEPTVAMWEMINEPGSHGDAAYTKEMIRAFFDETAGIIKGIDPNHLVASGATSDDMYGTRDYAYAHGGPNVDVATLHEYEYDYENSNSIITTHLAPILTALSPLNKPLVVGETGILAGHPDCRTSVATRNTAMQRKLTGYLGYDGVAGVGVWAAVQYNPVTTREPCPLEMPVTDPVLVSVKNAQLALNR